MSDEGAVQADADGEGLAEIFRRVDVAVAMAVVVIMVVVVVVVVVGVVVHEVSGVASNLNLA